MENSLDLKDWKNIYKKCLNKKSEEYNEIMYLLKNEIDYLVKKERDIAEYYTRRLIDYLDFNNSSFPEYSTNSNDDIFPDKDSLFNGWVLWKKEIVNLNKIM